MSFTPLPLPAVSSLFLSSFEPTMDAALHHSAVLARSVLRSKVFLGDFPESPAPLLYSGVAHSVEQGNILAVPVRLIAECLLGSLKLW